MPKQSHCQVCAELGVPIADHKTEGPTTCLTFLGIEVDTRVGELRLPAEKLSRLQDLLHQWGDKKVCSRRELASLIGLLNHACKVVRAGRSFLRRMIDLLHAGPHPSHPAALICLNTEFRSDLAWWQYFVQSWNGISFLPPSPFLPVCEMASDASGNWGCGAWFHNRWFQIQWNPFTFELPITVKELLPILVAGVLWGHHWSGHRVICHCDNQAVVACLKSRTSKHKGIMHLLCNLLFAEAHFRFHITPVYIDTHANHLADDLSRNRVSSFLFKVPQMCPAAAHVPPQLVDFLLDPQANWISPQWRHQFNTIFAKV